MFHRPVVTALALALVAGAAASTASASPVPGRAEPPKTAFEESNGASWTSHEQELEFLAEVDRLSKRVEIHVIGETNRGRPLHLVRLGYPHPDKSARSGEPTTLFVCSQH